MCTKLRIIIVQILIFLTLGFTSAISQAGYLRYPIDAALDGVGTSSGTSYFFQHDKYRRYSWDMNKLDDGGSLPVFMWHLPPDFQTDIDAAVPGYGSYSNRLYFFKGNQYVRYNTTTGQVDDGPKTIAAGWFLPSPFCDGVDAALTGKGTFAGKYYFFKGTKYVRFDWNANQVDQDPVSIASGWKLPQLFASAINAAVNGQGAYAGKAYFFNGDQFIRYDWATDKPDPGYPKSIQNDWPALLGLNDGPTRRLILFVGIEHYDERGNVSKPYVERLNSIAASDINQKPTNFIVDDWWCKYVTSEMLADPHMLAIYGSGSSTEWWHLFTTEYQDWKPMLNNYAELIKNTNVPIFTVCGSHQLFSKIYSPLGWDSVGHMNNTTDQEATIGMEERDQTSHIPNPRIGEVGFFPMELAVGVSSDPLFDGIPVAGCAVDGIPESVFFFVESHHDEVIKDKYPPDSTPVSIPSYGYNALQLNTSPITPNLHRCHIQALKYNMNGRIIYTAQFHPELTWTDFNNWGDTGDYTEAQIAQIKTQAAANGARFIRNFLQLATNYYSLATNYYSSDSITSSPSPARPRRASVVGTPDSRNQVDKIVEYTKMKSCHDH